MVEEEKMKFIKSLSGFLAIFLVAIFVLAIMSIVAWVVFWVVVIVGGIYAFKVLPRLKK
jgi:hypothetical protein